MLKSLVKDEALLNVESKFVTLAAPNSGDYFNPRLSDADKTPHTEVRGANFSSGEDSQPTLHRIKSSEKKISSYNRQDRQQVKIIEEQYK
mgnify:CR=1 FL=1